jgi:hypothetical protein
MTPREVAALIWFERFGNCNTYEMEPDEMEFWLDIWGDADRPTRPGVDLLGPGSMFGVLAGMLIAGLIAETYLRNHPEEIEKIEKAPRRVVYEERKKRL